MVRNDRGLTMKRGSSGQNLAMLAAVMAGAFFFGMSIRSHFPVEDASAAATPVEVPPPQEPLFEAWDDIEREARFDALPFSEVMVYGEGRGIATPLCAASPEIPVEEGYRQAFVSC